MATNNDFDKSLQIVLKAEGGYVNNPSDKGGETNKGITTSTYNQYRLSKKLPIQSVKNISDNEVREIYQDNYWLAAKCDQLPGKINLIHFDFSVNAGVLEANRILQKSIGVSPDGVIGKLTIDKLASSNILNVIEEYTANKLYFYFNIALKNPSQVVFFKGWTNRAITIYDTAKAW